MALIAMAVYCTEENKKMEYLRECLKSLVKTVDFTKHRILFVDNNSCEPAKLAIQDFQNEIIDQYCYSLSKGNKNITLSENIGTARAINKAFHLRRPGEHCIKMDDDVIIHQSGWVDQMEEAIRREPQIGIVGLKRNDLMEYPGHPNADFRSELIMLPHVPGERWMIAERVKHVMGTCQMYSSALLDKIGYLWQPSLYGYDDVLASFRSSIAGFINVFLPHIPIDHIDPGGTPYQTWKEKDAADNARLVSNIVDEYISGKRPIYVPFEDPIPA